MDHVWGPSCRLFAPEPLSDNAAHDGLDPASCAVDRRVHLGDPSRRHARRSRSIRTASAVVSLAFRARKRDRQSLAHSMLSLLGTKGVHMKNHEKKSSLYARCAYWMAIGCAVFAPLGCSGDDSSPSPTGTGGSGGTGATGGTGGEGGTAGTGGGVPDGATPAACGGFASLRCPDPDLSYCDYNDATTVCGQGDIQGVCRPRPTECPQDCPGVCGCDGYFYCNECVAYQAGIDVHPGATCGDSGN